MAVIMDMEPMAVITGMEFTAAITGMEFMGAITDMVNTQTMVMDSTMVVHAAIFKPQLSLTRLMQKKQLQKLSSFLKMS
jgi:hypothetical protein